MRAVTRHLLTLAVVGAAAVGVSVTATHGFEAVHAEPTEVSAVPAPPTTPTPSSPATTVRAYEQNRTSRSEPRKPLSLGALQDRNAALADQQRRIAAQDEVLRVEEERRERLERIERDGYDPETAATPREIGRQMAENLYGWAGSEWTCFDKLVVSESNWKTTATNPSSGAYGIPQALPASKLATAGPDWRTNPATQIKWGLKYIDDRYGSPCQAWSFKRANNWY